MKKPVLVFSTLLVLISFLSCTDESEETIQTQIHSFITPTKDSPENDRNYNGAPNNEE
ncbi:hypothetical protein [Tenacibaculum maritimum]|uniref:hypothetical protein n=1 Tax=Tenacibaculum maritimum TaxID=107401 RepID=UPI001330A4EA|nr:hypothetical protein [Tenacibaculum maritimum]